MHFWIDKRSQSYGYGRSRAGFVAASLGNGFDFYHPPRRFGHDSMVPPSNRFVNADCRPHWNRPNVHRSNVVRSAHPPAERFHPPAQRVHPVVAQMLTEVNITSYGGSAEQHNPVIQHCNQTHMPIDIDQGALDLNTIRTATHTRDILGDDHSNVTDTVTAVEPLLPVHLRFGMWTSLALATFILAAFLGRVLEVLIFYAFSAAFFLIAYPMALCRQPRSNNIGGQQLPNLPTDTVDIEQIPQINEHTSHVVRLTDSMSAPPPPYHIAILTTDNSKVIDDSPPPSYDKLIM